MQSWYKYAFIFHFWDLSIFFYLMFFINQVWKNEIKKLFFRQHALPQPKIKDTLLIKKMLTRNRRAGFPVGPCILGIRYWLLEKNLYFPCFWLTGYWKITVNCSMPNTKYPIPNTQHSYFFAWLGIGKITRTSLKGATWRKLLTLYKRFFSWWVKKKVPKTIPSTTLPSCFVAWHTWHFLFLVCLTKRKLPNCFSFSSFYLYLCKTKLQTTFLFLATKPCLEFKQMAMEQSCSTRLVWLHESCWSERIL